MKIFSMTGFGKGEAKGTNYLVSAEIKTVNNRFKDFKFRMSSLFNSLEIELRNKLEEEFKRGSFDISITYKKIEKSGQDFQVDLVKVSSYLNLLTPEFRKRDIPFQVNPSDFLRSDFYKDEEELKEKELTPLVFKSFESAIVALKISRSTEGSKLVDKLHEHLAFYKTYLDKVEKLKADYPTILRERLTQKLTEKLHDFKIDDSRLLQEIVYYLEKLEVDEEINRAKIHLSKLETLLKSSGEIGRQIDFLLQELGRETNTLGSKSAHSEISSHVVEMKVQLEKIREQALNLE